MPRFTFTDNGESAEFSLAEGLHALEASGTFDSGSIKLQTNRGGAWIDFPNTAFSGNGQVVFSIDATRCKILVTGVALAAADITVVVH